MIEKNELTSRQMAKTAGFSLVIMFLAAMIAEFYARQSLIVPGDAVKTAHNILQNRFDFCVGIVSFIVVLICDILAAWSLYFFLKPVNANLSLLVAWIRLVYTAIFGVGVFQMLMGYRVITHYQAVFSDISRQAMEFFTLFDDLWAFGLIFFGCHLLVIGYLILKSGFMPRLIGVMLLFAALAYITDSFCKLLMPHYTDYASIFVTIVSITAITGEVGLAVWLLVKGGKSFSALIVKS